MKTFFSIFMMILALSSQSFAKNVGMLTCLLKDRHVHLNIHNKSKVMEGYVFDVGPARYHDFSDEQVLQNDDNFIHVFAKLGEKSIIISYNRNAVQPKQSSVRIDEKTEKCECYYGEYNLDDKYF
jgi:hypothetical protein